jgi:hypothetical protein
VHIIKTSCTVRLGSFECSTAAPTRSDIRHGSCGGGIELTWIRVGVGWLGRCESNRSGVYVCVHNQVDGRLRCVEVAANTCGQPAPIRQTTAATDRTARSGLVVVCRAHIPFKEPQRCPVQELKRHACTRGVAGARVEPSPPAGEARARGENLPARAYCI